jgi:tRNA threonylcarbamoyladenosine biosynthesis protein TsaB
VLIVAIDTSGKNGSLALVRFHVGADESCGKFEALEVVSLAGGNYSAQLVPQLAALLDRHGIAKTAVDAYAVASGPGSFTGLRVGLSTVKALADATNKPIASITVLEAVAWQVESAGPILVVLDAGRKQVFVSEFLAEGRHRTPLSEHLVDLTVFAEQLKGQSAPVFTPDAHIAQALLPSGRMVTVVPPPMADLYARIGAERILAGHTVTPAELDANYIRRTDAEIFFQR